MNCLFCGGTGRIVTVYDVTTCTYCGGLGGHRRAPAAKRTSVTPKWIARLAKGCAGLEGMPSAGRPHRPASLVTIVLTGFCILLLIVALLLIAALLFGGH